MGRTRPAIHGRSTDRCLPPATAWCDEYERWREYMVISPRLCDIAAGSGDLPQSQNVAWGQHKVLRKDNGVGVENARSEVGAGQHHCLQTRKISRRTRWEIEQVVLITEAVRDTNISIFTISPTHHW